MTDKFNFDKIKAAYPLPDVVMRSGVDLKKRGNRYFGVCPFHGEKTGSFSVFYGAVHEWKYHCFGCGVGGDVINYVGERYGLKPMEAVEFLTGSRTDFKLSDLPKYTPPPDPYAGYSIIKPPVNAAPLRTNQRTPDILNVMSPDQKTGKPRLVSLLPKMVFPYRDLTGALLGYVLRIEIETESKPEKWTPQVWWTVNPALKFEGWSYGSYPEPRPCYGLDRLTARPNDQVLITGGEKCADAGERLFGGTGIVSLSYMGGEPAFAKTDWTPLKGRSVLLWPDNDAPGWQAVMGHHDKHGDWKRGLVECLFDAGVARVKLVHVVPGDHDKGWDIADAEPLGSAAVGALIKQHVQEWTRERFETWKQERNRNEEVPFWPVESLDASLDAIEPEPADDADAGPGDSDDNPPPVNQAGVSRERAAQDGKAAHYPGKLIDPFRWQDHLIRNADGDKLARASLQNAALMLQYERRFAGLFAWNEFANEVYIMRRPEWDTTRANMWPRKISEKNVIDATCQLEYTGLAIKYNDVGRAIMQVAHHNSYNPVTDALNALKWDGKHRIDTGDEPAWLQKFLGVPNTRINRLFGRNFFVGAVARAFEPGCKMDTTIIFEGKQGLRKSSALRVICDALAPGLFTDEISDPNSKDAGMQMQGVLIIEVAELAALRRSDATQIKDWLTRREDRFRPPFGKIVENFPRSCIFAGSVNPAGAGYLKDVTGGRRFEPVECGTIKLEDLEREAGQLWAEAVCLYQSGTKWWLTDEADVEEAKMIQMSRYEEDPFAGKVGKFVRTRTTVTTTEIMEHLQIPAERHHTYTNTRIAAILHSKGWARKYDGDESVFTSPRIFAEPELNLTTVPE